MPAADLAWGRVREMDQVFCLCGVGEYRRDQTAQPPDMTCSGESLCLLCRVTGPFQVNWAEASWNQNMYKSCLLWKTLPRSINTFEGVIEMWEGEHHSACSHRKTNNYLNLNLGKLQALADVRWQNLHVVDWNTSAPGPAVGDLHPCCRVLTRDYRQVHHLHQFSVLSFTANPALPADGGKARVSASHGQGRINTQGSSVLGSGS